MLLRRPPGHSGLSQGPPGCKYTPSREAKAFAADCAAYFSKHKDKKQCLVICAEARNVKKPLGGAPVGTVAVQEPATFLRSQ